MGVAVTKAHVVGEEKRPSKFLLEFKGNFIKAEREAERDKRRYTFKRQQIPWETAALFAMLVNEESAEPGGSVAWALQKLLDLAIAKIDKKRLLPQTEKQIEQCIALLFNDVPTMEKPAIARAMPTSAASSPVQEDR
ncbi:hypothetical protein [Mesoterricola silvestris]|uniref:Uncharacterized protein n=1 Tax=Mesoterricola silvestris TaxID=2927979 RepID=A0AA48K750_9BACT|nr:hypothetical protein [Mesoterricola silvestris]BDU71494.1 hypothetical protein METEAL_06680 [Mesoterricola silvestris]